MLMQRNKTEILYLILAVSLFIRREERFDPTAILLNEGGRVFSFLSVLYMVKEKMGHVTGAQKM